MSRSVTFSGVGAADWGIIVREYSANLERKLRSPATVRAYRWALDDFGRWVLTRRLPSLDDLSMGDIEAWMDQLREVGGLTGAGRAPRSQQLARNAVKECLKFAYHRGLDLDPLVFDAFVPMRVPRSLPRPLAPVHVDRINAFLRPRGARATLKHLRTRALWFYMVTTGARVSEVLQLDREDLAEAGPTVTQKGGSQKRLWAPEVAQAAVWDYLRRREDDHPAVFITHGNPPQRRLGPAGVREVWHELADDLGIPRFTTHQLRHTCATELLDSGVDAAVAASILGHKGLQSIGVYAEVRMGRKQEAVDAMEARFGALKPPGQDIVAIRNGRGRRVELA